MECSRTKEAASGTRLPAAQGMAGGRQSIGSGKREPGGLGTPRALAMAPGSIPLNATLDAETARRKTLAATTPPPGAVSTAGLLINAACCGVTSSVSPGTAGVV